MFKSIFERMFWTSICIITIVLISITAGVTMIITNYFTDIKYDSVVEAAAAIEKWTAYLQVENTGYYSHVAFLQTISSWSEYLDADIIITNRNGEIIETTNRKCTSVNQEYAKIIQNDSIIRERGTFYGLYSHSVYTVGLPVHYQGNNIGAMYFNLDLKPINNAVIFLALFSFLISAIGIITAFGLIYKQAQKITSPLDEINKAVLEISSGNFDKRIPIRSNDEIGQLSSSFNLMADSLEQLESMRSSFVSDVSHELRTPMTSISGFIQGILDGTIPKEKEKEYLTIVLEESNRLTRLVNDMLEMSKMQSSEYKLNVSDFDINELIRRCIIELEQRICEKELDLDVDFASESLMVCADHDAIKRVFINLFDNALKFSYPHTTITIKTYTDKKNAVISIGNFGKGIDSKDLNNIFNRFFKADASRTGNKSGAGLGLSFVKNIITLHKQNIWVQSNEAKPGSDVKFTEFTFTLELA